MQISHLRTVIIIILFFVLVNIEGFAQMPPPPRGGGAPMEKIQQIKKIKLLEILELDEESSNKFLAKYDFWEKKTFEKRKSMDQISDELRDMIDNNASKVDITKKAQTLVQAESEFFNMITEKHNAIKSILSEVNFAKYLVFESKFQEELKRVLMEKRPKFDDRDHD